MANHCISEVCKTCGGEYCSLGCNYDCWCSNEYYIRGMADAKAGRPKYHTCDAYKLGYEKGLTEKD